MNIRNIANMAGVSVATVSRVLNHPESVAEKTKNRVEKVISDMEYTPNWFARGLNFNKTGTIGIMIPDIQDHSYMGIVKGIEDIAQQKDYTAFMCNTENDRKKEKRYMMQLMKRKVDGIMLINPTMTRDSLEAAAAENLPIVVVGENGTGYDLNVVNIDCEAAAGNATEHLLEIGYKKIAIIYGDIPAEQNEKKIKGYEKALEANGIMADKKCKVKVENSIEGGYLGCKKLIEMNEPPQAIFATSDIIALGAIESMKDKKIRVPGDMAIVGFDNIRTANIIDPRLTTIDVPFHKMGVMGARMLFDIMSGEEESRNREIKLQAKLKIRKSCGHKERIGEMF